MQIGEIKIDNPVILAPMSGVIDYPYRQLARQMGCELLYTEMISSRGLVCGNKRTRELLDFYTGEKGVIAVQLFGEDPGFMARAAGIVEEQFQPDIIDINMGCPTAKIVRNGSGAALMREPERAGEIISAVVKAVQLPVTIKIRKGWDNKRVNAVEIAVLGEKMGIKAVTVHGRTQEELYQGQADRDIIKEVKESVKIPVIGNGDITSPELAREMLKITDCDGIMIGRGALGNPWLLQQTSHFLQTGELLPEPEYEEKIDLLLKHLQMAVDYYTEEIAIPKMRKHLLWYIKGMPSSSKIKERINRFNNYQDIVDTMQEYRMLLTSGMNHI
jgi:tRNA-dihydrouridine synthase B